MKSGQRHQIDQLLADATHRTRLNSNQYAYVWGSIRDRLGDAIQRADALGCMPQLNKELNHASMLVATTIDHGAAHLCLLAIERYLDLKSIMQSVAPILARDAARQEGCRSGGRNKRCGKLPPKAQLKAEAGHLVTVRGIEPDQVRKCLAAKYQVTPQAVGKALRKPD